MNDQGQSSDYTTNGFYSLPVFFETSDGERHLEKGTKEIMQTLGTGEGMYKDAQGTYKRLSPGISIDKKTGNVQINAMGSIIDEDWFKEKYANNDVLQKLSQAYKTNMGSGTDYKYETTDKDGNTVYKTVEEMLAEYDEGLKKDIESMHALTLEREAKLRPVYGDKVDNMSTEDVRIALTPVYNVGDYKVNDSTAIYLPDFLLNHSVFGAQLKKLASYDPETGTVKRGDFIENFWNRNKNKELTAERIQELYQNLGTTLAYSNWKNVEEDDYERKGSNQAAREIAFRNFIKAEDPQADFWLKAGDVLTSVVGGIGMGLADTSVGLMNFLEMTNNFLTPGDTFDSQVVKKTAEGWDNWKQYNNEQLELISDAAANITNIAELGTDLAANIYIGNLAGAAVGTAVGAGLASAGLATGVKATSGLGRFMTGVMAGLEASNDAKKAIQTAIGVQKTIARSGQLVGSAVNILTQATVDATLSNPTLFRKAIDGDGGEESYNYLREQAAWNVLNWGLGLGASNAMTKFADTKFGRAVNAKASQEAARLKTIGYDVSDTLKGMISKRSLEDLVASSSDDIAKQIDDVDAALGKATVNSPDYYKLQKQRTQLQNATLKNETKAFADADLDIFSGLKINEKALSEAEDYITNLKALQNAIDIENRSLKLWVSSYDDAIANPVLGGANKVLFKDMDDAIKAQQKLTTQTGQKFTKVANTPFSQEMSNYVGATVELKYMQSVIDNPAYFSADTVASAKKAIGSYQDELKRLNEMFSPELKAALDTYIEDGKKWYAAMNQYRGSKGIINTQDLEDLLQNPMFKEGDYMRVQRLRDDRYPTIIQPDGTRKTNVNIDLQHLDFTEFSDFMAPDLVQEMYKFKTARLERNFEVLKIRNSVNSASSRILVSGEDTQFVKDFKATKAQFNSQATDYTKKLIKDSPTFDPKEIKQNYQKMLAQNQAIKDTTKDIKKTQKSLENIPTKQYRINMDDRSLAVGALAPNEVNNMLISAGKSQSGSILQDGLDEFAGKPGEFQRWYSGLPQESKDTINSVRRRYNEYIGDMAEDTRPMSFSEWMGEENLLSTMSLNHWDSDSLFNLLSDETAEKIRKKAASQVGYGPDSEITKSSLPKLNRDQYYYDTIGKLKSKGGKGNVRADDLPDYMRSHLSNKQTRGNDEILWKFFDDQDADLNELYERYEAIASGAGRYEFTEEKFNQWLMEASEDELSSIEKEIADGLNKSSGLTGEIEGEIKRISYDNLKTLVGSDPNLEDTINLQVLKADKDLMKSDLIDNIAIENKRANERFIKEVQLADQRKDLTKLVGEQNVDSFMDNLIDFSNDAIDNYVTSVKTDPKMEKFIRTLAERSGCSYDDAARYLALSSLDKNRKLVADQIKASFGKADGQSVQLSKQVENAFDNVLDNTLDQSRLVLGDNDLVSGDTFDEVKRLAKEIDKDTALVNDTTSNIIATTDSAGRKVFMEVDPATATLFKSNIDYLKRPEGPISKGNRILSKFFRFGTTGANLSSTMRQWFRDTGNAVNMGAAFRTVQKCSNELVEDLGEKIVSQLSDFDYKQYVKAAEETGKSIEEVAVAGELRRASLVAGQTTEAELYIGATTRLEKTKNGAKKAYDKIEDIFNNKREVYLRNRVYANNLTNALNQGKTLEQARIIAEFAMNNATTNFSRKLVHLQRIADSTPYFSAAINGSKSFWRMLTLDPVAISTRIMSGLVVPQMALTASSLSDPKNREVYQNLPEYTKSENLVFVQNGIAMTIPIPQELAFIVDPFRQFVEHLYSADNNSFLELAANDILGVSPVDLTGFTTVDMDDMIADPTIFDRLGRGVARVFSQVAPVPVKSAYMVATGIDPYSGKKLRDKSWQVWNDDTQSFETMDYNQSSFAKVVASWFGKDTNVTIAEKVLSGIFGNTGMDVLDTITSSAQKIGGDENANPLAGLESQLGKVGGSLTGEDYNMLNSEWRRAIAQLEEERDAIMSSKEMEAINTKLATTDSEKEYQNLIARRKDLLADWQSRVASTVSRLGEQGGIFDRYKFAAVTQLLNMNSTQGWEINNKYLKDLASQNYYAGLNEANKTMNEIGIEGVDDYSIFGYIKYKDGAPTVVYNSPTAILNAGNVVLNAANVDKANIDALIKKADLYTQRQAMYDQTDAIYGKGKLSSSDYNKIDAIKMEFNNRVWATLAPYLEKVSPDAILNNEKVMDTLENLIQVPSAYEKVKGRYVSSGGGKLNKQQGFVRSYIKAVLKGSK